MLDWLFFNRKKHLRALYKINHLEGYNSELENNVDSLKLEIKRLNEVIACVSSRVIEIVEQENKDKC